MLFKTKLSALLLLALSCTARAATVEKPDDKKWQAPVPTVAENNDSWQKLVPAMLELNMPYGALAASRNMLNFFQDLPSKDLAFRTIVHLVDMGYQGSTRPFFVPGDIEPDATTDYGKSYFFYKALADTDKKMDRWAQAQFEKVDKEFFPKYIFYQGVQAYLAGHTDDAIGYLKKALFMTSSENQMSLARREARTLARIYYEKEDFEKSLEIYQTFLLKLNPVTPGDWLEAAWNLYRLKRYPEALGFTYNFESKAVGPTVELERYILRALIYREYCSVKNIDLLSQGFDKQFGKILDAIRLGEPLKTDPNIVKIELPETFDYRLTLITIEQLQAEQKHVKDLPRALRPLADYLYTSEIKMLGKRKQNLENEALQVLAKHLVILSESLKFLKFEVVRQKFNPDTVFADDKPAETPLVENIDEASFRLHWTQWGDYWRDERLLYRGKVRNRCEK
jgi:tetratricopeptide (TPR) repeat protein